MMTIQRLSSAVRSLSMNSFHSLHSISPSSSRPLFNASLNLRQSLHSSCGPWRSDPIPIFSSSNLGFQSVRSSFPFPLSMVQIRHVVSRRDKRSKRRKQTPVVSKLKKYKMKPYSAYKERFQTLSDGTIRRWKAGKRHNASSKSKEAKRRLRRPGVVHPAFATIMKKLNFAG